jgi:hypothetical protein
MVVVWVNNPRYDASGFDPTPWPVESVRRLAGQQDTTEACPSGKTEPHWEPMLGQCIHPSHRSTEEREA